MRFIHDPSLLIKNSNKAIEDNIQVLSGINLGLCAQNILSHTRNLLDGITLYVYLNVLNLSPDKVNSFNDTISKLKTDRIRFSAILDLYEYLETTASHFTLDQWTSIEIINVYADLLFKLRKYVYEQLHIDILRNLNLFPFNEDRNDDGFYINVAELILANKANKFLTTKYYYYIEKKKRIYTDNLVYYEYVVAPAKDKVTKFDRTTCYSIHNLCTRHAYQMSFSKNRVFLFDKQIDIKIIEESYVSIRPIEFTNLLRIIGKSSKIGRGTKGYNQIMNFLNYHNIPLFKALFNEEYFKLFNEFVDECSLKNSLLEIKDYISKKRIGFKTLSYLLCLLRNRTLKGCLAHKIDDLFDSTIKLSKSCLMFEEQPFALSLPDHITSLSLLVECLPNYCSKGQLLQRSISNNISANNRLYTKIEELSQKDLIDESIIEYNNSLNSYSEKTKLCKRNNRVTIQSEETDCLSIILNLNKYKHKPFVAGKAAINSFLSVKDNLNSLDEDKINILKGCFKDSSILCIKGSAGTGKTFLLRHLIKALGDNHYIFGCNTYSAMNNLRRRVSDINFKIQPCYQVVNKLSKSVDEDWNESILVLDECSTISNRDFLKVINAHSFKAIILAGDDYQIESIRFGNWFGLCSSFFSDHVFYLNENHRTSDNNLIELWKEVRNAEFEVLDGRIQNMGFIKKLSGDVFNYKKDQIVLCLNYDGLYGINNVNKYMQELNPGRSVSWNVWTFKENDPVLFTDSYTFKDYFYSNQKGTIIKINEEENKVFFVVRVESEPGMILANSRFVKVVNSNEENIDYMIEIDKKDDDDDSNEKPNFVVPFQLAYAISIHKSQGLEYDNVNIIIYKEIEESISFNVFYTAITRARKKLQIFSNEGSLRKIINHFSIPSFKDDANCLYGTNKQKMGIYKISIK